MNRESALMAAELELMSVAVRKNDVRLRELLHPDFMEIGRSGRCWNRDETIGLLTAERGRTSPEIDEWHFVALSLDLALVTYRASGDSVRSRHASIWDTSGARPVMRFHQGTVIS
ncbi:nuclear transport factor 2 family protein [Mycobacterium avium subsp. hominissuis]|uniref:DUF4440 domain-containing protein n=1 Tax=Mycobacterium paraffinicum TaxID=53378 RepID=A0ABP8RD13_9MYCO|nr:DUF4440 domain-containing protein [Mycobacterium avium]PBJ36280.1 nuclear transport factor 2 family protein [Mycobacterium avium subsp. hominissuis]PBJ64937.1 nuclear transport factor 2 family protein [Mycobacterium avium subsp. hominissuis]QLK92832.1 nuclear transport factor 2 family protein [Mycobacterium avium subsp. hominissuis]QWY63788.1 nuclear transport factor 2 family protein [Mycobacterium avium subsp. hominissuis]QWY65045.1 nuclear transport factor 2 family protein [Mycobacterium 